MFKEKIITYVTSNKRNRLYKKITYVYECDNCHRTFVKGKLNRPMHFCTKSCYQQSMKCGLAHDFVKNAITEDVKQQIKNTLFDRYGVTCTLDLPGVREKCKTTCLERYNSNSSMGSKEVQLKKEETFIKNYGCRVPLVSCDLILSKSINTQIEKYGDIFPRTQLFLDKRKITCLEKYGVENHMQNYDIFIKNQKSKLKKEIVKHWKTHEDIVCTASYEFAFVNWCNYNRIDFDWQIPHKMPDGHVYYIDAFIKDGKYINTWIEIKGWFTSGGKIKWEWFHNEYPLNSQLWNREKLHELQILIKDKPNQTFIESK
jgi:hypothetical protein